MRSRKTHTQSFIIPHFPKIGLTHKKESPVESPTAVTYPFAGERGEAHGCVFHGRKMRGVATKVDKSGAFAPMYPPSKRKSDLHSSFKRQRSDVLILRFRMVHVNR
ncbi:hypothetical protein HKD37_13G035556 [Glycine soja]